MSQFLILRPKKQAEELVDYLEDRGFQVFIEEIFEAKSVAKKAIDKNFTTAFLTSFNAIEFFLNCDFDKNVEIFVTGKKISDKLGESGYKNVFFAKEPSAKNLEELFLQKDRRKNGKILYFCGNFLTRDFSKTLGAKGFEVQNILSYKIDYRDEFSARFLRFSRDKKVDYVICYSKNVVRNFAKLVKKYNLIEYFENTTIIGFSAEIITEISRLGFKKYCGFEELKILNEFKK